MVLLVSLFIWRAESGFSSCQEMKTKKVGGEEEKADEVVCILYGSYVNFHSRNSSPFSETANRNRTAVLIPLINS